MEQTTCPTTSKVFSVLLHVLILFSVLGLLFILVISKMERSAFNGEIDNIMSAKVLPALKQSDPELKSDIQSLNFDALIQYYSSPSEKLAINNSWLRTTLIIINAALLILIIAISLLARGCISFKQVVIENILVFIVIGAFEYLFFHFVASRYIPVLPSTFESVLYTSISSSTKSSP